MEAHALAPSELGLHHIKLVGPDDGLMAFIDVVLLNFTLVDFLCLCEKVHRVAFLRYNPTTDTIQLFFKGKVQRGFKFIRRVQQAEIRYIWPIFSTFLMKYYLL